MQLQTQKLHILCIEADAALHSFVTSNHWHASTFDGRVNSIAKQRRAEYEAARKKLELFQENTDVTHIREFHRAIWTAALVRHGILGGFLRMLTLDDSSLASLATAFVSDVSCADHPPYVYAGWGMQFVAYNQMFKRPKNYNKYIYKMKLEPHLLAPNRAAAASPPPICTLDIESGSSWRRLNLADLDSIERLSSSEREGCHFRLVQDTAVTFTRLDAEWGPLGRRPEAKVGQLKIYGWRTVDKSDNTLEVHCGTSVLDTYWYAYSDLEVRGLPPPSALVAQVVARAAEVNPDGCSKSTSSVIDTSEP